MPDSHSPQIAVLTVDLIISRGVIMIKPYVII